MTDFLLELRSEEIPARMQARAREDLARLFAAELARAGLAATDTQTYATPRRLALVARGLPDATAAVTEEVKGPRTSAPPQALDGFLRKTGLTAEQLIERDGVWFAVTQKPGRATADVLADAVPAVIRAFPWPKSMRWGDASASTDSLRWVRPLHGIVALFGEDVVPVEMTGVTSGAATLGHRFHHPGPITIGSAHDYVEKLRACHVIVDPAEREALIRDRAAARAAEAGLELVPDELLVAENAGLTEWPVPLLGRFDKAFLAVPPEVIQLTARVNQKYFVLKTPPRDGEVAAASAANGRGSGAGTTLANAFICTANIAAADGGARIVEGNRKVLAARLADARFFYEGDLRTPLAEQAKKLDRIVFHEKLGTVADKVERVAKLARWLVEEGIVGARSSPQGGEGDHAQHGGGVAATNGAAGGEPPPPLASRAVPLPASGEDRTHLAALAERAARLAKADLVTGMVGEFPELQGVMGGYYAAAQGEDTRVAAAIRDHYKPVGQGDAVPTDPVTVAVSLADKLDTLFAFFSINEAPTGSRDPFALRRAAISVIALVTSNSLRLPILRLCEEELIEGWTLGPMLERYHRSGATVTDTLEFLNPNYNMRQIDGVTFAYIADEQLGALSADAVRASERLQEEMAGVFAAPEPLLAFFADRLKVQQREAGVRHDLIDAVFALGGEDDLVRLLARVRALQAFVGTEDGANLLTGYRRAANILKKEGWTSTPLLPREGRDASASRGEDRVGAGLSSPDLASLGHPLLQGEGQKSLSYTPEPAENALMHALDTAEPRAAEAVAAERFEDAMTALASLRAPIDAFFDSVTVNDPAPAKRTARLALLARVRDAVHAVADFSRIEG